MPLEIIRNDITKVSADAIVNTANPMVAVGYGVDSAIYEAAGKDELLAERAKIGVMRPGEIAETPAFNLDAKYIIHAVGPAWQGGRNGEIDTVAECYKKSLERAKELDCESIAFPLLAAGTYGFPKDVALQTAVSEISRFLFNNDMTVYLVVYDKEAFEVSGKAFSDIREFISEGEIKKREMRFESYLKNRVSSGRVSFESEPMFSSSQKKKESMEDFLSEYLPDEEADLGEENVPDEAIDLGEENVPDEELGLRTEKLRGLEADFSVGNMRDTLNFDILAGGSDYFGMEEKASVANTADIADIDDIIRRREETFQEFLFRLIDRKGLEDKVVYKKANIDRKHFSKIRSNVDYNPSKRTALALAIALELNLDETKDLLLRAGIALSKSNTFDLIMEYCINHNIKDIYEINCILFKYNQPTLGA